MGQTILSLLLDAHFLIPFVWIVAKIIFVKDVHMLLRLVFIAEKNMYLTIFLIT